MTERIRDERAGIDFPDATWTSFDRYDRYGGIARCLRATLGEGRLRVLDVGDAAGYLGLFAGDVELTGVDVAVQPHRLPGATALVADGSRLPFPDRAFDAVVSSDVLEHVRVDERSAFIAELSRVARDLVVVAAPFDTAGVAGVEEMVRRFVLLATGAPQEQLDEHRERTLPDLDHAVTALGSHGEVAVKGNGNLWDWLELMLVKHQLLARPALLPLHDGIDVLYNISLAGRSAEPPHYRHLLAARRSGAVDFGGSGAPTVPSSTMAGILTALAGATAPEATRQDVRPALDEVLQQLAATQARLAALQDGVVPRLLAIERQVADLRRPLAATRAVVRRVARRRSEPTPEER